MTDSQRFGRKKYDDFDYSNEQAARKALHDGHDPRAPEIGPYKDRTLRSKAKLKNHNVDHMDMIDNIMRINHISDEIDQSVDEKEQYAKVNEIKKINDELEKSIKDVKDRMNDHND